MKKGSNSNFTKQEDKINKELEMFAKDPFRFKPQLKRQIAPQSPPIAIKMSMS